MTAQTQLTRNITLRPKICPDCLTEHLPLAPHDKESLFYNCTFFGQHGRWPTWSDAIAHCSQETRSLWGEGQFHLYCVLTVNPCL